jgi:hypothetical protein
MNNPRRQRKINCETFSVYFSIYSQYIMQLHRHFTRNLNFGGEKSFSISFFKPRRTSKSFLSTRFARCFYGNMRNDVRYEHFFGVISECFGLSMDICIIRNHSASLIMQNNKFSNLSSSAGLIFCFLIND